MRYVRYVLLGLAVCLLLAACQTARGRHSIYPEYDDGNFGHNVGGGGGQGR